MRVKLSYTANVEDILTECAYLTVNKGDTLKAAVELFNSLVTTLQADEVNPHQVFEMIEMLRQHLTQIDIRLMEIEQIVSGHEDYQRIQRTPETVPEEDIPADSASRVISEELEISDD